MGLLDTKCYGCTDVNPNTLEMTEPRESVYQGGGKFRCPNCMEINLDLSEYTYNMIIAIGYDEGAIVISPDKRMSEEALNSFSSDLDDVSRFKAEDSGVYKCEIYWHYYQCGGEEPEWDLMLEFLSMNKIELNEGD